MLRKILYRINQITENTRRKEKSRPISGNWIIRDFMAKTANLYARIEPDLKEQAEQILNAIGLPPSSAITMFYKQVVMQQGLPFDAKLNYRKPMDISSMTKDEFDFELEKGYQDAVAGRTKPIDEVFESLNKEFGI